MTVQRDYPKHMPWVSGGPFQASTRKWLSPTTQILSIGSCFAVNFGRWLNNRGGAVLPHSWGLHFNPLAIYEEFMRTNSATDERPIWTRLVARRIEYYDPLRYTLRAGTEIELIQRNREIDLEFSRNIGIADAFLITLGLAEIWEEQLHSGRWVPLNVTPPVGIYDCERHRVRLLSIREIASALRTLVSLIRSKRSLPIPIVFTVSPVPLKATFSADDVRVANSRSKAALLMAVHELLADLNDDFLSYFPAYEIFHDIGNKQQVWQEDLRHPTALGIELVCGQFLNIYSAEPSQFKAQGSFDVKRVSRFSHRPE